MSFQFYVLPTWPTVVILVLHFRFALTQFCQRAQQVKPALSCTEKKELNSTKINSNLIPYCAVHTYTHAAVGATTAAGTPVPPNAQHRKVGVATKQFNMAARNRLCVLSFHVALAVLLFLCSVLFCLFVVDCLLVARVVVGAVAVAVV